MLRPQGRAPGLQGGDAPPARPQGQEQAQVGACGRTDLEDKMHFRRLSILDNIWLKLPN